MIIFICAVLLLHKGLDLNKINVSCLLVTYHDITKKKKTKIKLKKQLRHKYYIFQYSKTYDITVVEHKYTVIQKHPFADVSQNICFRNIHRKTPVLEILFTKVAGLKT